MTLAHLRMRLNIFHPMIGVVYFNFLLLIMLMIMSVMVFAKPSGIVMAFPENVMVAGEGSLAQIAITAENVIYFNEKVVTLNELRRLLLTQDFRGRVMMVKVDRLSSMGRVADVLDICRGVPGMRVNVATLN